jgi:hypothetical protein
MSMAGGYGGPMITTTQFADAIGRSTMANALKVKRTAISNAVVRGSFPPAWLEMCRLLSADKSGIECPPQLFGQRPWHDTQKAEPKGEGSELPRSGDAA